MSVIPDSRGAGNVEYRLTIRYHGPSVCTVSSHPQLRLIGAGGERLPTHVKEEGPRGIAVIRLGEAVSAKLRFSPDIPGPGEPAHGPCEPLAHEVSVMLTQIDHRDREGRATHQRVRARDDSSIRSHDRARAAAPTGGLPA